MARKRMIDPGIWTDPKVIKLSNNAFIVFVGLISHADDEGIVEIDPDALYFKLARRDLEPEKITECIQEIAQQELLVIYGRYGFFPNWFKHQTLNRPTETKYVRPPKEIIGKYPQYIEKWEQTFKKEYPFNEHSLNTHGQISESSVNPHEIHNANRKEKNRIEGNNNTLSKESAEDKPQPKEIPEETKQKIPAVAVPTVEYFLAKTGRGPTSLTEKELDFIDLVFQKHIPSVVQNAISTALRRKRFKNAPQELDWEYIWDMLKNWESIKKGRRKNAKFVPSFDYDE